MNNLKYIWYIIVTVLCLTAIYLIFIKKDPHNINEVKQGQTVTNTTKQPIQGKQPLKPKVKKNPVTGKTEISINDTVRTETGDIYINSDDIENKGYDIAWNLFKEKTLETRVDTAFVEVEKPFYEDTWFYLTFGLLALLVISLIN